MEKIININFHSRIIAIEESAYEALKQYTESLRRHFADEESSEEIVNDIENRIAELLAGRLKQGAPCINVVDLNAVIDSIGRIEDIKAAEGEQQQQRSSGTAGSAQQPPFTTARGDRFYRNADDKIIAGVCRGLADRMNIDPVVVRIIFVIFFGAFFWIYMLLWLILPSQSHNTHITRRLFRNPDDKQIAGVCGGLAQYFHTDAWKVRILFLLPLLFSGVVSSFHPFAWHWGFGPGVFAGSLGSSFFLLYIILWIAVPYATTDTDKMEMRGERIDINSIAAATQARGGAPVQQPRSSGLGRVLGIIFKAFFILIAGSIALGLFGGLVGMVFVGSVAMPFTRFFLEGWEQHALLWTGVVLSMGIPLLSLIVWLVRRIAGVRTQRHYLAYVFAVLWFIGITSALITAGTIMRNFTTKSVMEQEVSIQQPATGTMYITVDNDHILHTRHYERWFADWDEEDDVPFRMVNDDSLWLNTVQVHVDQSPDSLYHVYMMRSSRGNTNAEARTFTEHISFNVQQRDSLIRLQRGFVISRKDKFRNQQVRITVEVPTGKSIQVSSEVDKFCWFSMDQTAGGGYSLHDDWDYDNHRYSNDGTYIMTANGLKEKYDTARSNRRTTEDSSKSSDY